MKSNKPEARLKDLEIELGVLDSVENEASLKKEMAFRQAIEDAIPSGITVIDDTGKQVYVNRSFCNMVGWSEEELLGKQPPYEYWAPGDMVNINNALQLTLLNIIPKEGFDLVFRKKTGKLIPVQVIVTPFQQENKKIFFLANVIDITERKNAEAELKKSQLLLVSSIESQKDTIIFFIDCDYRYLYFNKAHEDSMRFAYNVDVKIGMSILDYITSDSDRKLAKENYDRALHGESHTHVQAFGDLNRAYYESFFNPILNENDEIIGCTGLARDITNRELAARELKESETKFKEIINQINDVIIVFDQEGKIVIWNKGAENFCGLKAEEILEKSIVDIQYQFTPPPYKDKKAIESRIKEIISHKTPDVFNQVIDSEIVSIDSQNIRNIQSKVFPIELNGYNLFCTVIRDTTEIKRFEKELIRISADKDKFYSVIAQHLYAPFSLFRNFSKLMTEELDSLPVKEIQKMSVMMGKSATNLYSLLDNLLQWTKMNQGNVAFKPQKLNFIKTCKDAVSILIPYAEEKNIRINHFAKEDTTVIADIFMLKTILRNLVSNAIRFSENSGVINISAMESSDDVIVSVVDSGIGISPEHLNKIFTISESSSALGVAEEKGITLGLLLCKEFVEKHGGKIWVENKKENGSELKFSLPAYQVLLTGKS